MEQNVLHIQLNTRCFEISALFYLRNGTIWFTSIKEAKKGKKTAEEGDLGVSWSLY
jgi:hypothetical protein